MQLAPILLLFLSVTSVWAAPFSITIRVPVDQKQAVITYFCRMGNDSRGEVVNIGPKDLTATESALAGAAALRNADTICKKGQPVAKKDDGSIEFKNRQARPKSPLEAKEAQKEACANATSGIVKAKAPNPATLGGTTADECKSLAKLPGAGEAFTQVSKMNVCSDRAYFEGLFDFYMRREVNRLCDTKFRAAPAAQTDGHPIKKDDTVLCHIEGQVFDQLSPDDCAAARAKAQGAK